MDTRTVKINGDNEDRPVLEEAARLIASGEVVAFPTETVYGLGGDALNPQASRKIYAAKGRPSDNPLIVHIADMKHLEAIAASVSPAARVLAKKFWPGPLTMIFPKKELVPYETTGGLDTVAVRMPSHPVAKAFIQTAGGYIAAPSANTSGRPSPTKASHVQEDLNGRIPLILDGGEVDIGLESTIVDMTGPVPVILRPGYVTREMLEAQIGPVELDPALEGEPDETVRPKAPGMKYRHYAPRAKVVIVEGGQQAVTEKIQTLLDEAKSKGLSTGVIATDETRGLYRADVIRSTGRRHHSEEVAAHLYEVLRDFDHTSVQVIYSESFGEGALGQAVMNRLLKAAGHQVIPAD